MSNVLIVGSVAFDTLHMPSGSYPRVLGGSATYGSLAASMFAPTRLVGVVGRDFPDAAVSLLRSRNIDLEGLEVDASGDTFHWEGRYSDDLNSRESLKTELNVFSKFAPKIPASFRNSPFVMLGNIHPTLQRQVLDQVERPKLVVADTMNFWITGERDELIKTLARVDLLVVNDEEARQLSGEHNLVNAAKGLMKLGPKMIVIKKGEHGALLFERRGDSVDIEIFSAPAYPTGAVVDPTGAGDTFAGGLIGYVASTGNTDHATLRRAIIYGSALASYTVEGISTERLVSISRADVDARYASFHALAHFGG